MLSLILYSLSIFHLVTAVPAPVSHTLYVATYDGHIYTLDFQPSSSTLQIVATSTQGGFEPGWLTLHNDKLYSVSRAQFADVNDTDGGVFAFQTQQNNPNIQFISASDSGATGGVYCDVSPDGTLISVADIDGSAVSIHPLSPSGVISNATSLFRYTLATPGPGANDSQIISNPHSATFTPSGKYLFVADRGADRVYGYRVNGRAVDQFANITLELGTGPRHLLFHELNATRTIMYLVSEIDNTVRVFALDGEDITLLQRVSTLQAGDERTSPTNDNLASELALSSDGRFLYATNRITTTLDPDSIAIYSVSDGHHLEFLGLNSTYGKIPRDFALSPDTQYAAVANQVSNNLIIMKRDARTGSFGAVLGNVSFGAFDLSTTLGPVAVVWKN